MPLRTCALLARFEEANQLFLSAPREGLLSPLVARTWLDSAIAARDLEALQQWLSVHEKGDVVAPAIVSYARAYASSQAFF